MRADILVNENELGTVARAKHLPADVAMVYDTKAFARRLQEAIDDRWPNRDRPNDKGQIKLAELTELPQGQISHLLAGKREPKMSTLARVAEKLDVSLDWLVFGLGTMRRQRNEIDSLTSEVRQLRATVEGIASGTFAPPPETTVRERRRK